jgi:hypothetical protein
MIVSCVHTARANFSPSRFSKGFILTIKMKHNTDAAIHDLLNRIHASLPSAVLKEKYMDLLTFHINAVDLKWSEIFAKMKILKEQIDISDYSVTQMSLEQVFLHFTRDGNQEVQTNGVNGHESTLI